MRARAPGLFKNMFEDSEGKVCILAFACISNTTMVIWAEFAKGNPQSVECGFKKSSKNGSQFLIA